MAAKNFGILQKAESGGQLIRICLRTGYFVQKIQNRY